MKVLLDTNAYSAWKRGHRGVAGHIARSEGVLMSAIVAGELVFGFRAGAHFSRNIEELSTFLASPYVELLPVNLDTAERYGWIAAALRRKGKPIPTNDIWIAAHAMQHGASLLSFDPHFSEVDGLVWYMPAK
ncbi:MAG: type II toxin-antitoxin system VapC family toxin [Bradymonadales bacterium]|nr:type II toxin-antitoxin system VapC family toxin [Bradymonadales bacterium]